MWLYGGVIPVNISSRRKALMSLTIHKLNCFSRPLNNTARCLISLDSEYLEGHQTELDKLTAQLKDMKRNSRLVSHQE